MANTKPYVRIHSTTTINVTAGLQHEDVTNADAHVPDRLKVNPLWPKLTCKIMTGAGIYPSYITEWPTVKALVADKIITIGEFLDEAEKPEQEAFKAKLDQETEAVKAKLNKGSLADIAR